MKYALNNCSIIDGTKDCKVSLNKTILIDGEIIVSVNNGDSKIPEDFEILDLSGKYVMPGMINLHAHLFGTGKPSKSLGGGGLQRMILRFIKTKLGDKVLLGMVKKSVTQAMNSGVTTIRGVGDFQYSDVKVRNMINSGKMLGPRLIVSGPAITVPGGHGDGTFAITGATIEELKEKVRLNKSKGVDFIKICVTGGVMDATKKGEPGILRMSLEETKAICEEAHKNGFMVASHTESSEGVKVDLLGGVDTVEHGSKLNDELINHFIKNNSKLVCTISPAIPLAKLSSDLTMLDELSTFNSNVVLEGIISGAKTCIANGIPVGLGTDASCPFVTQYNMWRELCYFAKYVGVSNSFAIHSATLGNAKILGIDKITGSIESGKYADIIVTDENPLLDLKALRDVEKVICRGSLIENPRIKKNKIIDNALDNIN